MLHLVKIILEKIALHSLAQTLNKSNLSNLLRKKIN